MAAFFGAVVLTRSFLDGGDRTDAYYDGAVVGAAIFALAAGFTLRFVQVRNRPPPLRGQALFSPWALVIATVLVPLAALPQLFPGGDDDKRGSGCETAPADALPDALPSGYDYGPPPPAVRDELRDQPPARREVRAITRDGLFKALVSVHEGGDRDDFDDFTGGTLAGARKRGAEASVEDVRLGAVKGRLIRAELPHGRSVIALAPMGCNILVVTAQDETSAKRFARWILRGD